MMKKMIKKLKKKRIHLATRIEATNEILVHAFKMRAV
jgi:hypothetical protein